MEKEKLQMEMTYTHAKKTPDFINKQMDKGSLKKLLGQRELLGININEMGFDAAAVKVVHPGIK